MNEEGENKVSSTAVQETVTALEIPVAGVPVVEVLPADPVVEADPVLEDPQAGLLL
jgi:hypothetical protein